MRNQSKSNRSDIKPYRVKSENSRSNDADEHRVTTVRRDKTDLLDSFPTSDKAKAGKGVIDRTDRATLIPGGQRVDSRERFVYCANKGCGEKIKEGSSDPYCHTCRARMGPITFNKKQKKKK